MPLTLPPFREPRKSFRFQNDALPNPHFGRLLRDGCAQRQITPDFHYAADDLTELLWLVSAGTGLCPCSLLLGHQVPPGAELRPLSSAAPKLAISLMIPNHGTNAAALALSGVAREQAKLARGAHAT